MKQSDDRKPIVGALFRGVIRLLSWLPLRYAQAIGAGLGWLLWRVPNSVKRISEKNIALAFADQSAEQQAQLVKASLIELGKTATELGPLWCWSKQRLLPLVKEVRGAELIELALAQGRGVIVLSPHLGAWEMMGWYWSVQYPITSLYRPPRIGSIENFMRQVRERGGATLVPTDMSGVKALRKALKNNEIVGILPDQDPGKSGGVVAPFFGHPANTMLLVAKLAQKAQCPVFYTFAERLPAGAGYRIHVIEASAQLASTDDVQAASALNQGVETCARINPAQYQWSYKRYKNLPDGYPRVY